MMHKRDSDTLYHGTSAGRWAAIQSDGHLKPAELGYQHVSLTTNVEVARYFAELAREDLETQELSHPVILMASRRELIDAGFDPAPFHDPIWGDGECDWEEELAVCGEIPVDLFRAMPASELPPSRPLAELRAIAEVGCRRDADPTEDLSTQAGCEFS